MTRSNHDVENLFASQGIPGRYRELARHPAPSTENPRKTSEPAADEPRSKIDTNAPVTASENHGASSRKAAASPEQDWSTPPRRGLARLGLVMPAPAPQAPENNLTERPLGELFSRLTKGESTQTPPAQSAHRRAEQQPLRDLRLPALFAHLERNGKRR